MSTTSTQPATPSASSTLATAPESALVARPTVDALSLEQIPAARERIDPLESGTPSFWSAVAARSYREGILPNDFSDASVVVLGDSNHSHVGVQKGLLDLLPTLKVAGITHIAIEVPADIGRDELHRHQAGMHAPHLTERLIATAERLGFKVEFIDMPFGARDGLSNESVQRGIYMGERAADILNKDPNARVAVVAGYGHVRDAAQIGGVLSAQQIPFRSFLCIAVGQSESLPVGLGVSPVELDVVAGIRQATGVELSHGVLNLQGLPTTVDSVLVLPRPALMSVELRVLNGLPAPDGVADMALQPSYGRLNVPVNSSFAHPDFVATDSGEWERTNQQKIVDFADRLRQANGLRTAEAAHIATMLNAHQYSGPVRNFGGSIVELGFVADGQFFEVVSVDTLGYPFKPDVEHGALMRHQHVTLQQLCDRYDYRAMAGVDIAPLPKEIAAADDPTALLRFLPYAVYGPSHPRQVYLYEQMGDRPELRVAFEAVPGAYTPFVTSLRVEDFKLTPGEQLLLDQRQSLSHFVSAFEKFRTHPAITEVRLDEGTRRSMLGVLADWRAGVDRLELPRDIRADVFSFKPERRILGARAEFRTLDSADVAAQRAEADTFAVSFETLFARMHNYLERHPQLARREDTRFSRTSGVTPADSLAEMRPALEKLRALSLR